MACSDQGDVDGTVTPTASASPTTTEAPSGSTPFDTATEGPADPLRPPGSSTKIAEVDRVITAVLNFSGDYSELDSLVRYTETECTLQVGMGGPPKCWNIPGAVQAEGSPVVVFPFSVCEAEWEAKSEGPRRVLAMLVEPGAASLPDDATIDVYGVYSVPSVAELSDWPAGDHAVLFARRIDSEVRGTTVRIDDGGIVSIEFGCGSVFPAIMAAGFVGQLLQPPLAGLTLAGDGVILSVEELPSWAVEETLPRWRVVIDLAVPIGGYQAVLVDAQTTLLRPDGSAATVADLLPGATVAVSGVPLPWSLWWADQVTIGD